MILPDLIVVWPRAFDYPLFREQICRHRHLFDKVIISFTHNSVKRDYRKFLKTTHKDWIFVDSTVNKNWYDDAVNEGLYETGADWVMLMEQDFLFEDGFLEKLFKLAEKYIFVANQIENRVHFSCFLGRWKEMNKTVRFFGTIPEYRTDCFDLFCMEMIAQAKGNWKSLQGLKMKGFKHLTGLTQNYNVVLDLNQPEAVTGREEFLEYNQRSLKTRIKQSPEWLNMMRLVEDTVGGS